MSGRRLPFVLVWRKLVVGAPLPWWAKWVAVALSLHMDGDGGSCWPSVSTLAAETGLSRATVFRALAVLADDPEKDGKRKPGEAAFIVRRPGGHGPTDTTRYRAVIPRRVSHWGTFRES